MALFARYVAERIDGRVLRYSLRLNLIDMGRRLGVSRFDANLVIAAVQQRRAAPPLPSRGDTHRSTCWALPALTFLCVQGTIVLCLWAALFR